MDAPQYPISKHEREKKLSTAKWREASFCNAKAIRWHSLDIPITLVAGAAEVFGAEMVINRSYSFTDAQQACRRRSILALSVAAHACSARQRASCVTGRLHVAWLHTRRARALRAFVCATSLSQALSTRPALIQTAGQHCTLIQRASTPAAAADCAGGLRDSHGELPAIAHGAGGAPREGKGARH